MTVPTYNGPRSERNPSGLIRRLKTHMVEMLQRRGNMLMGWDKSLEDAQTGYIDWVRFLKARWHVEGHTIEVTASILEDTLSVGVDVPGGIFSLSDAVLVTGTVAGVVDLMSDLSALVEGTLGAGGAFDDEDGAAVVETWSPEDVQAAIEDAAEDLLEEAWEEERECLYCSGGCPECDPLEVAPTLSIVIPAPSRKSMIAGGRLGAWATNTGEPIDVGSLEPIWNDPGFLGGDPESPF